MDELMQMLSRTTVKDPAELAGMLAEAFRCDVPTAQFFLAACGNDVQAAANQLLAAQQTARAPAPAAAAAGPSWAAAAAAAAPAGDPGFGGAAPIQLPSAAFEGGNDLEDGLTVPPGETVRMAWRFVNTGPRAWPRETVLRLREGETLGAPQELPVQAAAGQAIVVNMALSAPMVPGLYSSCWSLCSNSGYFGDSVWAVMQVPAPDPALDEALASFGGLGFSAGGAAAAPAVGFLGAPPPPPGGADEDMSL